MRVAKAVTPYFRPTNPAYGYSDGYLKLRLTVTGLRIEQSKSFSISEAPKKNAGSQQMYIMLMHILL